MWSSGCGTIRKSMAVVNWNPRKKRQRADEAPRWGPAAGLSSGRKPSLLSAVRLPHSPTPTPPREHSRGAPLAAPARLFLPRPHLFSDGKVRRRVGGGGLEVEEPPAALQPRRRPRPDPGAAPSPATPGTGVLVALGGVGGLGGGTRGATRVAAVGPGQGPVEGQGRPHLVQRTRGRFNGQENGKFNGLEAGSTDQGSTDQRQSQRTRDPHRETRGVVAAREAAPVDGLRLNPVGRHLGPGPGWGQGRRGRGREAQVGRFAVALAPIPVQRTRGRLKLNGTRAAVGGAGGATDKTKNSGAAEKKSGATGKKIKK